MRHCLFGVALFAVTVSLGLPFGVGASTGSAPTVRVLTCSGKTAVKPVSFVISCADGNTELTKTTWTKWTASAAIGTTDFGINLCNPTCVASRMQFFAKSSVTFSAPLKTKRYGTLFSSLVVNYELKGKSERFTMSWKGIPVVA